MAVNHGLQECSGSSEVVFQSLTGAVGIGGIGGELGGEGAGGLGVWAGRGYEDRKSVV